MIYRLSHRPIILANEFYYPNVTRGHCGGLVKAEAFNETTANTFPTERSSSYGIRPFPQPNCCPSELDRTSQLPWKLDQTQSLDLSKNFDNEFSNLDRIHPFGLYDLTVKSCIPNFFKLENLKLQFYTFVPVKLYDVKLDARKVFSLQNWRNYNTFRNVGQRSFF